jgi:hypothetical protein
MDHLTVSRERAAAPSDRLLDGETAVGEGAALATRVWRGATARPVRIGSEEHKALYCRMLLETHNPYRPAAVAWPALDERARRQLRALPIWDIAVQTEGKASLNVRSYAETIDDPLLRQAIELNGFEEARHKELLATMVSAYDIKLEQEPPYPRPRDPEWAFMVTGFSECIDSFFAFGLFEASRRAGLFPVALANSFEPVMQEECRHILFFVNWVAWHRRNLLWWRRPIFAARILRVWLFLIWERIRTANDLGGGNNFTMSESESFGIDLSAAELLELCLAENERRLSGYDQRLLRPTTVPRMARLARRLMGMRARISSR